MPDEEKLDPSPMIDLVSPEEQPFSRRLYRQLSEEVDTNIGSLPLIACCFATGLTDGTLYNAYGTFVSMQTGNTVFVALGASGQNNRPFGWARSLCSIGCFTIGCLVFSRLHKLIGGGRLRRTVFFSFLLQTVFVVVAATIIQTGIVDGRYPSRRDPNVMDFLELAPVALLSFQAAGQITNSRGLGLSEVPTVVITTLLCDLISDERILDPLTQNVKRNRRAVAFLLTLLGAICGGWISKATGAVQPSLWFVAAIKATITIFWLCVRRAK
ncbi:uncharacterized protein GGS25DRAFT_478628 [Hypoxylon fragiforme]|uniref:uncharacterized protein n=1 Tax=Hypoxylon fragiforme TaxID=63214 RepID=UPI0020C5C294|nr:uncharacterized protein GGS25DRAFT_478628 [Hypoxylon fragiforme]KAI2613129.1 hypothetical protein GGS25DRAFT_478628 [Hypoxylon fragiforme]